MSYTQCAARACALTPEPDLTQSPRLPSVPSVLELVLSHMPAVHHVGSVSWARDGTRRHPRLDSAHRAVWRPDARQRVCGEDVRRELVQSRHAMQHALHLRGHGAWASKAWCSTCSKSKSTSQSTRVGRAVNLLCACEGSMTEGAPLNRPTTPAYHTYRTYYILHLLVLQRKPTTPTTPTTLGC